VTVHFIGAGPGAVDLLTLRARDLIAGSPVCLYAGTYVRPEMLDLCPEGARKIDTAHMTLTEIVDEMVAAHREGLDVARLASGDLSVFSALAEQMRRLDAAGVPYDLCPGVPAYAAAAAPQRGYEPESCGRKASERRWAASRKRSIAPFTASGASTGPMCPRWGKDFHQAFGRTSASSLVAARPEAGECPPLMRSVGTSIRASAARDVWSAKSAWKQANAAGMRSVIVRRNSSLSCSQAPAPDQ